MRNTLKCVLLLFILSLCAGYKVTNQAVERPIRTFKDPGKPIILKPDEHHFVIVLKSNPSTGFSWFLKKYNNDLIEPVGHQYLKPANDRMGAGGIEKWRFKVKSDAFEVPHIMKIKFIYTRPWDLKQETSETFTVITPAQ